MATEALDSILDRDLSKVAAAGLISVASPLLQELVNHATNALVRCDRSTTGGIDEDAAPLALYRHLIEVTDGIEILVANCAPSPAIPLLRSAFEALLGLEFVCEKGTTYVQRSLSWLVSYIRGRLRYYDCLDPDTPAGAQFAVIRAEDKVASTMELPAPQVAKTLTRNLAPMLSKPHLQSIEAEYRARERGPRGRRRRPAWYSLFDGPANLRELALYLKRGALYDLLYRPWSRSAHAEDFGALVDGDKTLKRLRDPANLKQAASLAASFMLAGTRIMIDKFRRGEDLRPWYIREVQDRYQELARKDRSANGGKKRAAEAAP